MLECHVINDLQWGSCAKRLFTEYYANKFKPDVIISNGMPNSGGYDSKGIKWSAVPIGYPCKHLISPGAVVNTDDLKREIKNLPEGAEVLVHKNAGVITPEALESERVLLKIGSTMTGGMAATVRKMKRDPNKISVVEQVWDDTIDTQKWLEIIRVAKKVLILCAQGHGLSINWGFYPYTTARNTSPAQAIADAGIPPQAVSRIIGCCRPYPIRVSNRYDKDGKMVGFSGPCYKGQREMSWEEIGVPPEITSVSKKVRRVFSHSMVQLVEAAEITGTTDIFAGFINYLPAKSQWLYVDALQSMLGKRVAWVGHGKTIDDICETSKYGWDKSWV